MTSSLKNDSGRLTDVGSLFRTFHISLGCVYRTLDPFGPFVTTDGLADPRYVRSRIVLLRLGSPYYPGIALLPLGSSYYPRIALLPLGSPYYPRIALLLP